MEGSVILKTLAWAIPSSCLAVAISYFTHGKLEPMIEVAEPKEYRDMAQLWIGFSFMVGFLITFRTAKAYNRWWEGATLLQQARGEWVNCFCNCIAFCTANPSKAAEVRHFREYLAFLMSLLFSAALNAITQAENDFEVLTLVELPDDTLDYLRGCSDQVEVIICWISHLIIENMRTSVVDVPPPVLSRVFQELSRGVVNINDVRKIAVFLFPFPYAQLIGFLLLLFTVVTPVVTGMFMQSYLNAFLTTFTSVFSLVALNFVAMEIECPFGTDPNDLPMQTMQDYMNRTLEMLLEERTYTVPKVEFGKAKLGNTRRSILQETMPALRHRPSANSDFTNATGTTKRQRGTIRQPVDFGPRQKFVRATSPCAGDEFSCRSDELSVSGSSTDHGNIHGEGTANESALNADNFARRYEEEISDYDTAKQIELNLFQEHEALVPPTTKTEIHRFWRRPPITPRIMAKNPTYGKEHEGINIFVDADMSSTERVLAEPQLRTVRENDSVMISPRDLTVVYS